MENVRVILDSSFYCPLAEDSLDSFSLEFSSQTISPNVAVNAENTSQGAPIDVIKIPNISILEAETDINGYEFIANWITLNTVFKLLPIEFQIDDNFLPDTFYLDLSDPENRLFAGDESGSYHIIKVTDIANTFVRRASSTPLKSIPSLQNKANWIIIESIKERYPDKDVIAQIRTSILELLKEIAMIIKFGSDAIAAISGGATGAIESALMLIALGVYIVAAAIYFRDFLLGVQDYYYPLRRNYFAIESRKIIDEFCASLGFSVNYGLSNVNLIDFSLIAPTQYEGAIANDFPENNPVPEMTFMEFCESFLLPFNIQIMPTNVIGVNTLFIRQSNFMTDPSVPIPAPSGVVLEPLQYQNGLSFTHKGIPRSYRLSFASDGSDSNTYSGGYENVAENFDYTHECYTSLGFDFSQNEKLERSIPYALGLRKEVETAPEKLAVSLKNIATILGVGDFFFVENFSNRNGCLKIGTAGLNTGRILLRNDSESSNPVNLQIGLATIATPYLLPYKRYKLSPFNNTALSAKNITFTFMQLAIRQQFSVHYQSNPYDILDGIDMANLRYRPNAVLAETGETVFILENKRNEFGQHTITFARKLQTGDLGYIDPSEFTIVGHSNR